MTFSRVIWAILAQAFIFSSLSFAESSEECLNRLTREREEHISKMCWSKAEGAGGVISDNSKENQDAIKCEDDAKKVPPSDAEMQTCFAQDDNKTKPVGSPKAIPNPTVTTAAKPKAKTAPTATPKPAAKQPTTNPTAKKTPNTNPSGSGVAPEAPERAQNYASTDLDACLNARTDASRCCNNPMACSSSLSYADQMSLQSLNQQMASGPKSGQSISDYCSQMRQASTSSGSVNNGLSSVCYSNQSSCTSTCTSLVSKYQALLDNCNGCDSEEIYASTLQSLQSANGTCQGLKANVTAMAQQGIGSSGGSAYGSICQQQASYNNPGFDSPTSNNPSNSAFNDMYGCAQNPQSPACQTCAMNPNGEACKALQQGQERQKGQAGFQTAKKKDDGSGFDTASLDPALTSLNAKMKTAAETNQQQIENQHAVVPNNTGGTIPGQGSNAQATLANNKAAAANAQAQAGGTDTDIIRGNLSGGYSQGSGFEPLQRGSVNTWRTLASVGTIPKAMQGVDLKKYLPGGDYGRIGGNSRNPEINGKGTDLFKKVSNKLEERCKLGMLWDCKS